MRIDSRVAAQSMTKNINSELVVNRGKEQLEQADSFSPQTNRERISEDRLTEQSVIAAIEKANEKIQVDNTRLEFLIHEKTHEIMVKVYQDDRVIREIPSEKILDMVAQMLEMAGLLVDERV